MSIATEIQRIQTAKAGLKTSIEAKGVTVPSATKIDGYPALVDQISSGGGTTVEENNVNFYDYDGELVYSYTKAEFLALTAMPANPSHEGFTAQGWNWSLSDAQDYVNNYDYLNIGQHYVTSDGKTRVYVHLDDPDYLFCQASWDQSVANGVSINWGDGSESETVAGTGQKQLFHLYQNTGDYMVEYTVLNGAVRFGGNADSYRIFGPTVSNASNKISIYKIELGSCNGFHGYCFNGFFDLETLNIPSTAGTWDAPCSNIFYRCRKLQCVVIPNGVTYPGIYAFCEMYNLKAICVPNSITQLGGSAFRWLYSIKTLTFPPGILIMSTNIVADNRQLKRLIMPDAKLNGVGVTYSFGNNVCTETLPVLKINGQSDITTIPGYTYTNCHSLKEFTIPSTVTSIGAGAFSNCQGIKQITIPNIATITNNSFGDMYALKEINIPATVTKIEASAFIRDGNLKKIVINPTTPPTLASTNAFTSICPSCMMIVPFSSLASYRSATNWSGYRGDIVGYLATEPTQVDYISSDGTAYINTLVPMSDIGKVQVEYRFQGTATGTGKGVVDGVYNQDGKYANIGRDQINTNLIAKWGGSTVSFGANDGGWHTFEIDVIEKTTKLDNNSSVSLDVNILRTYAGYCIFRPYSAPGNYYTEASDRRSVKIWDIEGNLVRDMIPVKIDGNAYMYDRVDKLVFANANSTGTLSYTDF